MVRRELSLARTIHPIRVSNYFSEAFDGAVFVVLHPHTNFRKQNEIFLFWRFEGKTFEMRNDSYEQFLETTNFVFQRFVRVISSHIPTLEMFSHEIQHFTSVKILTDREAWFYFPTHIQFVPFWEWDTETSFTIYISRYVVWQFSFQSRRIITFHAHSVGWLAIFVTTSWRWLQSLRGQPRHGGATSHGIIFPSSHYPWNSAPERTSPFLARFFFDVSVETGNSITWQGIALP